MKTKSLLFAACLFFFTASYAQKFAIGIKGGANLGKISGMSFKDEYKLGYQVGGFATIPLGERIAIQPEVLFNQTNVDTSSSFSDIYNFKNISNIELKQLTIPILLNVNINKYLTLQAGPQFGVAIDQNKNWLDNGKEAFKTGDFAVTGGLQVNLLKFRLYGRFTGGMTNLDNIGNKENWKVQNISVGLGIAL